MKRILLSAACVLLCTIGAWAQKAQVTYTLTPSQVCANQPVTVTIDASGTSLAGGDVYFYTFSTPGGAAPANPGWPQPMAASTRMTPLGGNRYSFTFTPQSYYGVCDLTGLGFLARRDLTNNNDANQSQDVNITLQPKGSCGYVCNWQNVQVRTFPTKPTQDDIVTIYFDSSLASSGIKTAIRNNQKILLFSYGKYTDAAGNNQQDICGNCATSYGGHGDLPWPTFGSNPANAALWNAIEFKPVPGRRGVWFLRLHIRKFMQLRGMPSTNSRVKEFEFFLRNQGDGAGNGIETFGNTKFTF
jgi:hypothetical protein